MRAKIFFNYVPKGPRVEKIDFLAETSSDGDFNTAINTVSISSDFSKLSFDKPKGGGEFGDIETTKFKIKY